MSDELTIERLKEEAAEAYRIKAIKLYGEFGNGKKTVA